MIRRLWLKSALVAASLALLLPDAALANPYMWPQIQPYYLFIPVYVVLYAVTGRFFATTWVGPIAWTLIAIAVLLYQDMGLLWSAVIFYQLINLGIALLNEKRVVHGSRTQDIAWYAAWSAIFLIIKASFWSDYRGLTGIGDDYTWEFSLLKSLPMLPFVFGYVWLRDRRYARKKVKAKAPRTRGRRPYRVG